MAATNKTTELRQAVWDFQPFYWRAAAFAGLAGLLLLLPTGYMLEVYDRVINSRSHATLAMLTLLVLAAFVLMEVLEWAGAETLREASERFDQRLSPRVFHASFEARLKGLPGGSQQPLADLRTVRDFFYAPVLLAVLGAPVVLIFTAILFAMSPVLGWATVAGALAQALLTWLTERNTHTRLTQANAAAQGAQRYADGALRNAQVIESMGMLGDIHRRWLKKQREMISLQASASDAAGGLQALARMVQQIMGSLLLGLGAWLMLHNLLDGSGGLLIVGSVLGGRVLAPLVQIGSQWRTLVNARDAWARLAQLLDRVPVPPERMALPAPQGLLSVEGLVAGAPGSSEPILKGIQLTLQPGEVLAVVGPSASGKSTLARCLVGLWPAGRGAVRLDGADVFAWNKAELGPHIGYLPQTVELIEGTLAENIARFGEIDLTKVQAAARAVGLHEFILKLPQGYDAPVGRDGAILSGGQRQRVALARALYGEPAFVVLDEPNASLDEDGDAALSAAIQQFKSRGTSFVVMTHRTGVLAVTDQMLVLREGSQYAQGPRDEVLAKLSSKSTPAQGQATPAS